MLKFAYFSRKANSRLDEVESEILASVPKWGMENAIFFNIVVLMGKTRNIVYMDALKV
jgi:hypothetical protein